MIKELLTLLNWIYFLSKTILDIDECQDNNGGCEQKCQNKLGSFECSCNSGLQIDTTNGKTCIGK